MAMYSCPICGPTGEAKCEHWDSIRAISLKPEAPQRLMMNCPNCCHSIVKNGHFVPPSFRDAGFYACESVCDRCVAAQPEPEAARPIDFNKLPIPKHERAEQAELASGEPQGETK